MSGVWYTCRGVPQNMDYDISHNIYTYTATPLTYDESMVVCVIRLILRYILRYTVNTDRQTATETERQKD